MLAERWAPSWGLRALAGVQGIVNAGLFGVVMWFFFPHVLLVPFVAVVVASFVGLFLLPYQVLLDPGRGFAPDSRAWRQPSRRRLRPPGRVRPLRPPGP